MRRLESIATDFDALTQTDFGDGKDGLDRLEQLCKEVRKLRVKAGAPLLFRTMERLGDADLGTPGPLVHTLEAWKGYQPFLIESIDRKPTPLTVWMINRIINADAPNADEWLERLRNVAKHKKTSRATKDEAADFIEFQEKQKQGPRDPFGDISDVKSRRPADKMDVPSRPPPKGAIVLLDGKDLKHWIHASKGGPTDWTLMPDGAVDAENATANMMTRRKFGGKFVLHVEFRVRYDPESRPAIRGEGGIYLPGFLHVQIQDSYTASPKEQRNPCAAISTVDKEPTKNVCKAPTIWQSFDIEFQSATRKPATPALITVRHNGILVHKKVKVVDESGDLSKPDAIMLRGAGNVQYRNIWLLPM
jgi:Domain of Unknown Function (DUF1080)